MRRAAPGRPPGSALQLLSLEGQKAADRFSSCDAFAIITQQALL